METSASVLGTTITTSITEGCKNVVSGATEGITSCSSNTVKSYPFGLEVMALTVGIRLAVGFFRSLAH